MDFTVFAQAHGLLIRSLVIGKWVRVPTTDHTKKRNGAYKFMGDHGFVQNWATQTEASLWRPDTANEVRIDPAEAQRTHQRHLDELRRDRARAADKAKWILDQCTQASHAYLARKGFPEERGLVWMRDGSELLVIPMLAGKLVGCQVIQPDGTKTFLKGQVTGMAHFTIGQGPPVLCEGYATGLSIRAALAAAKLKRSVIVCFSANNLAKLAKEHPQGIVFADHDKSGAGEAAAKQSGLPYWISPVQGEDFNDYHQRAGLFKASQEIKQFVIRSRGGVPPAASRPDRDG